MSAKLGLNAKTYRLTTGSRASWGTINSNATTSTYGMNEAAAPSNLDEIPNIRDLSLTLEKSEADVSTRASAWKALLAAQKQAGIEFGMVWDSADADCLALLRAWLNGTTIALAVLDGDKATVGSQGLWADFQVFSFSKSENLEEGQLVSVSLKPTYSSVPPEWVNVTA